MKRANNREGGSLVFTFITYIFSSYAPRYKHNVLDTKGPGVSGFASLVFSYFTSIYTSADTRSRESSDTRTLARNSHSRYTQSGGGNLHLPIDGWMVLVRNYLVVITTGHRLMTSRRRVTQFWKYFQRYNSRARRYYERRKSAAGFSWRESDA